MAAKRPNIVWFITDDTSDDMLGYAGGKVLTPAIDSIARDGVICTQYHTTSPACCPSRYSYLTGTYPAHCPDPRFQDSFGPDEPYNIGFNVACTPPQPTIAGILRDAGYHTGFVGKWHAGSPRHSFNGHQFNPDDDPRDPDVARKLRQDYRAMQKELQSVGFDYADSIAWGNTDNRPLKALQYHNLEWHTSGALEFLSSCEGSDTPFFLNMATTTIHGPHHVESLETDGRATEWGLLEEMPKVQAPRESVFARLKAAGIEATHRAAGALWTDDAFRAVMEKVEAMGLADSTIFIFSTDHGVGVTSGKFTCYQGGVRIPHTLKWQGQIDPGTTCDALLQNADFLPTILDMAGVAMPEGLAVDGVSRWEQLRGAVDHREDMYFEWGHCRAVRTRKWKYVAYRPTAAQLTAMKQGDTARAYNYAGKQGPDYCMHHYPHYFEPDQLYDLEADPNEQHNVVHEPKHAEVVADLRRRLKRYLDTFDRPFDLTLDPFMKSSEYDELVKAVIADRKIFETYFYLQDAY